MRTILAVLAIVAAGATIQKAFNGELIDGEYIVVFHKNVSESQRAAHMAQVGGEIMFEYSTVIQGYAVKHSEESMIKISEDPIVAFVEQNQIARAISADGEACEETPRQQHWGLRRVSTNANNNVPLRRDNTRGTGVNVYIIDTGIYTEHSDFGGRAQFGFDCTGEGPGDGNGHGTHCASTASGTQHGVAAGSSLFAVKVLSRGGSGTFACVIRGIEFVGGRTGETRRVGSMSLGGGYSAAVNQAVNGAVAAGAAMISASGNSNANACNFSPASSEDGVCVNSMQTGDGRSTFSNWGTCSHIFAPGTNILGAWIGGTTATRTISGTSMACPHVTGVIAEFWGQQQYAGQTGRQIQQTVIAASAQGRITNPGNGSPNRLVQTSCAQ